MMQFFSHIRPFTRNLLKPHYGRRSFTLAAEFPRRSSLLFAAHKPNISFERKIGIYRFHTSPLKISTHGDPETFKRDYPTLLHALRDTESSWMKDLLKLEGLVSNNSYMSSLAGSENKLRDAMLKLEEKHTADCAEECLPEMREKIRILSLITSAISDLDVRETLQSSLREEISLIKLRTELFLPFRVAVKLIVQPKLSAKPKKICEEKEGDYLLENCSNADRDTDYSLFLKQFKLDVESGNLDSFLSGIRIDNAREFYEICEFALKGDREAFRHVHQFWIYYMEEEVSECDGQFHEFGREGILELIGNVKYSESMPKNCLKMVDYLSKLI